MEINVNDDTDPEGRLMNNIASERGRVQDSQLYDWDYIFGRLQQDIERRESGVRREYLDLGRADDGLLGRIEYNLVMLKKAREHFQQLEDDLRRRDRFHRAIYPGDMETARIRVLVLNEQLRTIYRMIEEIVDNTHNNASRFVKKLDLLKKVVHQGKRWDEFFFNMKCRIRDLLISVLTLSMGNEGARDQRRRIGDRDSGIIKKKLSELKTGHKCSEGKKKLCIDQGKVCNEKTGRCNMKTVKKFMINYGLLKVKT